MTMPDQEIVIVDQLRRRFADMAKSRLTETHASANNSIDKSWLKNIDRLTELVLHGDPSTFLQWDVILKTMVVGNADFIHDELKYLKELSEWESRWRPAIIESPVGQPTYYDDHPTSSGNLIHQAYHVANFETTTDICVSDAKLIVEFGGGYGSMCRLVHNLNFKGNYIIFDLPQFAALQHYYLNMSGIATLKSIDSSDTGVMIISDLDQLENILTQYKSHQNNGIFIANWSLSESPVNLRESVLSLVVSFNAFLIAFQGLFNDIDNLGYFTNWSHRMKPFIWHNWKIKHLPNNYYRDNYYLIGSRK